MFSLLLITVIIFKYETSHSITIDPKKPFLRGEYEHRDEQTLKHQKVFCENCQFFDGTDICLEEPMSVVNDARAKHCKAMSMFVPK